MLHPITIKDLFHEIKKRSEVRSYLHKNFEIMLQSMRHDGINKENITMKDVTEEAGNIKDRLEFEEQALKNQYKNLGFKEELEEERKQKRNS